MTTSHAAEQSAITYVVELTPVGRAAVAVVLVDGPAALAVVEKSFTALSGRRLRHTPIGRIVVGSWGGQRGEELVVARRGECRVEVQCHGGLAAVRSVVNALVADGCHEVGWREWVKTENDAATSAGFVPSPRRVCNRGDATTWSAQIALADALTLRTAAILLDQMHGALSKAIHAINEAVNACEWMRAADAVASILQHRELGLHLTNPWRVVLAGAPNVGKSSLINALAGFERAIVSPIPGTTRDVVTLTTAIGGWPVELADTAGLRSTNDELEAAGVRLTTNALASADVVILVHDATLEALPSTVIEPEFALAPAMASRRVLRVSNKVDLLDETAGLVPGGQDAPARSVIYTSATHGEGITELAAAIERALAPKPPAPGAAVAFQREQVEALMLARDAIARQQAAAVRAALQPLLAD